MTSTSSITAEPRVAFRKLLGIGLLIWLLAALLLIGVARFMTHQDSLVGLVTWAIDRAWLGFFVGLLGIIVGSTRYPGGLKSALVAYVSPMVLVVALAAICYAIFPDAVFLAEMMSFMFLGWVFGFLGWLWLFVSSGAPEKEMLPRALMPPLLGGVAVLIGVVVPTFQSNAFIYRNAFDLTINKTAYEDGKLVADAVLQIHKPGDYSFRASRFTYEEVMGDPEMDNSKGEIDWLGKDGPTAAQTGSYPLTIRWDKNRSTMIPTEDELFEDSISLEVYSAAEPQGFLHVISVPIHPN